MKTFMSTLFCSRVLLEHSNQKILFTRYTMTSANDTVLQDFKDRIEEQGIGHNFIQRKNDVFCPKKNSKISFRGIKTSSKSQTAKHKGLDCNIFFVDEAEEWQSEEEFDKLDYSIRQQGKNNLIVIVMNPSTKGHWVYKRWIEQTRRQVMIDGFPVDISTHPEVTHIHTSYLDNIKNLPSDYVKILRALKVSNPAKYAHVVIGQWLNRQEGLIYENWREGAFDESLPYLYAMDFGFYPDPLAMLKFAIDKKRKRIYVKELIYDIKLSNERLHETLKKVVEDKKKLIICDTNEPRTVEYLKSKGWRMKQVAKFKGSLAQGIKDLQDWEIIVDPLSSNMKIEYDNYVWMDKKSDTPTDMYNHLRDCKRYAFMYAVNYKGKSRETRSAAA